jgi:putative oxidoreductase
MLSKLHALLAAIGTFLQSPLLLVVRLYWGWHFVVFGWGKIAQLDKAAALFQSLNIPLPRLSAMVTGSSECICGLLLILGLFSRFATLVLIWIMCVAYATAMSESLHSIFSDPNKFVTAIPFLFLLASLIVFAFGPGRISIDALVGRDKKG